MVTINAVKQEHWDFPWFSFFKCKAEIRTKPHALQKPHKKNCYPQPQFSLSNPQKEIVSSTAKGTTADFQSCSTTGFRSGRSLRRDSNTIAQWQAPIWTCCQEEKQKEPDHSLQVGMRACLRLCCSKWQWLLTDTVRDHRTPIASVSLRETRGGRQVPLRPAGCPSAPTVLSTHVCTVASPNPSVQRLMKKKPQKTTEPCRGLIA